MKTINIDRLETICGRELTIFQRQAIYGWAKEFEDTLTSEVKRQLEHNHNEVLLRKINYFLISIAFVLHFNEKTKFGKKRIFDVLNDIQATVDMFVTNEYSPKDYEQMLRDEGININVLLEKEGK